MTSPTPAPRLGMSLAALSPPPSTLSRWAKVIYYAAETVATGVAYQLYEFAASMRVTGDATAGAEAQTWRRFQFRWNDTNSSDNADDQYFTLDVVNLTNGQVDSSWIQSDYDAVYPLLYAMIQDIAAFVASRYTCVEVASYVMAFNPYSNAKPLAKSGPPEWVAPVSVAGAATATVGPQVCSTVTEETPSRLHWGRFYMPTVGASAIGNDGRFPNANVDALCTGVHDMYAALMDRQYFPVVVSTQANKTPTRTLQTVTGVRVDNVLDVHRSRRHRHQTHQSIQPVAATTQPARAATA